MGGEDYTEKLVKREKKLVKYLPLRSFYNIFILYKFLLNVFNKKLLLKVMK